MKKTVKSTLIYILSAVLLFCAASVSVSADSQSDKKHATGLIWDEDFATDMKKIDSVEHAEEYTEHRLGDINGDGKITASDARTCLRVSAKLEEINAFDSFAADVDSNGKITASDARTILRVSANLENMPVYKTEIYLDIGTVIGPFYAKPGYTWTFNSFYDGIELYKNFTAKNDDGSSIQYFILWSTSYGSYPVSFNLTDEKTGAVTEKVEALIYNNDNFYVKVGEQFKVSGIYTSDGGYSWKCTVEPSDDGITFDHDTILPPPPEDGGEPKDGEPAEEVFTFTANKAGDYVLHFEFIRPWETEAIREFYIDVSVK